MAKLVVGPWMELGALQHLVNGWRGDSREDVVARENHDRVARQEG